ncbi:unnamed protein product, partial [Nesidiocoris tenuis]
TVSCVGFILKIKRIKHLIQACEIWTALAVLTAGGRLLGVPRGAVFDICVYVSPKTGRVRQGRVAMLETCRAVDVMFLSLSKPNDKNLESGSEALDTGRWQLISLDDVNNDWRCGDAAIRRCMSTEEKYNAATSTATKPDVVTKSATAFDPADRISRPPPTADRHQRLWEL